MSSGTTPKLIQKESQVRLIGYGSMLTESFVAVMALIAACVLEPGLFYAMNSPAALLGPTVDTAAEAVKNLGFTITPEQLTAAAKAVEEETLVGRSGGAPTLAVGMSEIFAGVFGGAGMKAFWYHFAIMFEALFILTTVDAGDPRRPLHAPGHAGQRLEADRPGHLEAGHLDHQRHRRRRLGLLPLQQASPTPWAASSSCSRSSASPINCSPRSPWPSPPPS